jgi:hypothetical protein
VSLYIKLLVSILVVLNHVTSRIYAPPDDGVVKLVHSPHTLLVKGEKEVSFSREACATSKVDSYA